MKYFLSGLGVGVVVVGTSFFLLDVRNEERTTQLSGEFKTQLAAQNDRIAELENRLGIVADQAAILENDLALTTEEQQALADAQAAQKNSFDTLTSDLNTSFTDFTNTLSDTSPAAIATRWEQYVYRISCDFPIGENGKKSGGSAVLVSEPSGVHFITNEHVVEEDGLAPDKCELLKQDADQELDIAEESITVDGEDDVAGGPVDARDVSRYDVTGLASTQYCREKPAIGDAVVILGYPEIGASQSITVTEGIISGFDTSFYLTSAKIDEGHSGGAAIDVARDCFLGLPTFVKAGTVESLARILPITE